MLISDLRRPEDIAEAAALAAAEHARLRSTLPRLPSRDVSHYEPMLAWMAQEGDLLGMREGNDLVAFLGGFVIDNYRNAGPGTFCPDWCHGAFRPAAAGTPASIEARAVPAYRILYRELAARWVAAGIRIHAAAAYASDRAALEAFSLTGFGRIVMDAAVDAAELLSGLSGAAPGHEAATTDAVLAVRRAVRADAATLASLNARLAAHIGASPVLMPGTRGSTEDEWESWFDAPEAVCFVAEREGKAVAYIKAETPQFDVSDAVHGERTLAINGLYTETAERRTGTASLLLTALAAEAVKRGMELVSVDCETTNIEAYAFWSRPFHPVAWSLERRV